MKGKQQNNLIKLRHRYQIKKVVFKVSPVSGLKMYEFKLRRLATKVSIKIEYVPISPRKYMFSCNLFLNFKRRNSLIKYQSTIVK